MSQNQIKVLMMNNGKGKYGWGVALAGLVGALGCMVTPAPAQDAAPPTPAPAPEAPAAVALDQLPALAMGAKFDQVALALRNDPAWLAAHPQGQALLARLDLYHQHQEEQAAKNQKAYAAALEKMAQAQKDGKIDDAMLALIDAHSVAADPGALLAGDAAQSLVHDAQAAAQTAQEQNDWLQALTYDRLLDALYDQTQQYRPQVRAAERHLRLLRLYAPDELKKLYLERAKRQGKDNPDLPNFGNDTWEAQLAGVDLSTLEGALLRTATLHVSTAGYRPLLLGALDALDALATTPNLAVTFPAFSDAAKLQRFRRTLADLRILYAGQKTVGAGDLHRLIQQVGSVNRTTLDLPEPVLAYEMGDGAMANTDDFSAILWPREKEDLIRTTRGSFSGVGILIGLRTDPLTKNQRITVVSPLANTPARQAGIKPNDIIVAVDGNSTLGWSIDDAVHAITGDEGTDVRLGLQRPNVADPLAVTLTRRKIPIESVRGWDFADTTSGKWNYWIDQADRIGYVRISQFIPQTAQDLDAAVEQMQATGPIHGLIVDLRYDPGGLLSAAVDVVNRFVAQGVIVSTVLGNGQETDRYKARADRTYPGFPVVVLVNEGSASASEIVSGALQDFGRAEIVGERSFGKGSVQDLFPLDQGEVYVKVTTHYYKLPKGRIIHRRPGATTWGIEPDLVVKVTPQQNVDALEYRQDLDVLRDAADAPATQPAPTAAAILEKGMDLQLEAALLVLQTRAATQDVAVARK